MFLASCKGLSRTHWSCQPRIVWRHSQTLNYLAATIQKVPGLKIEFDNTWLISGQYEAQSRLLVQPHFNLKPTLGTYNILRQNFWNSELFWSWPQSFCTCAQKTFVLVGGLCTRNNAVLRLNWIRSTFWLGQVNSDYVKLAFGKWS